MHNNPHDTPEDNPEDYPKLGRMLGWVDRPGNDTKIFYVLCAICVVCFGLSWTFHMHGHFHMEEARGFYAIYGFVMFSALIFAATFLRILVKRREDFYGDKAIDCEDYPEDQLQRLNHNDD
ncbi:hypothetical protein GCM10007939_25460 [Amylibacter marinus]|uniref:Uncharacterized protein n=1 Tax=Amylibacter marinus TaxID=1475483 RepID=A0ABQ5VYC9_9RHOB|nr:hypothetical protein [Amylibacter marinus]GLQ36262.1 hypothetical protein GCM10007939_25460 [Amylibacter marinus]